MAHFETLEIERSGRVATIWMNRPAVFNAFDEQLIDELHAACRELDADRSVRVVVLAGRGKHFSAGADLINGLVNGVSSKLTSARDSIVSFGSGIKGWFTHTLGIKSPSRVFMGFGDNIAQGAAIGIGRSSNLASQAAAGMASRTAAAARRLGVATAPASRVAPGTAGGMVINFSPTIQVQGGSDENVKGQVNDALRMSMHELEKLIRQVAARQERRAY